MTDSSAGKPRRVTIEDVARRASVSAATVSRSLRKDPQISEATRLRVTKLAAELGYVPNQAARSLVLQHTSMIALVIPDMADPLYGQVSGAFEQVISTHEHQVILACSESDPVRERRAIDAVVAHRAAGIAIFGSTLTREEVLDRVGSTPCVLIDSESPTNSAHFDDPPPGMIRADDASGIEQIVDHLIEAGYYRIAYAAGPDVASNAIRQHTLTDVAARHGLPAPQIIAGRPASWREPNLIVDSLVNLRPEVVVCYDDKLALGVMNGLRLRGIAVPRDMSIVGFDDIPFASLVSPRLTTVAQPSVELGRQSAQMLLNSLEQLSFEPPKVLPVELIVRESTPAR